MKALLASINCQKAEIGLNLNSHRAVVLEAKEAGCDVAVFPEMSLTGYLDPAVHAEHIVTLNSSPVLELIDFGASHSVDLLFGIVERGSGEKPYITQVHSSDGAITGVYRKRNLADDETSFEPGIDSYQAVVEGTAFGVAVCADYEVADEFVAASESGAQVVFHPSAPGLYGPRKTNDELWQSGFDWWRSSCVERHGRRARELGINIAVCTQAGATFDEDFPGWAALFGPDGEIVTELPDWRAGTLIVEI
ncbi:MAG: carbon-nitrogen hydrolase family protein [Dehalococcoidia bacterium]